MAVFQCCKQVARHPKIALLCALLVILSLMFGRDSIQKKSPAYYNIFKSKPAYGQTNLDWVKNLIGFSKTTRISNTPCWRRMYEDNLLAAGPREKVHVSMCAFKPKQLDEMAGKLMQDFSQINVLHIGVHLGPAADIKVNAPRVGFPFTSWERRDRSLAGITGKLAGKYDPGLVRTLQKTMWNKYRNDPQLVAADVIICGFDTWHCLIFAPFNKKIILNSAYRFDGHYVMGGKNHSDLLQKEFYKLVRFYPDAVMAGTNPYDAMYHQHFLGSHKLVPLLAVGDHSRIAANAEDKAKKCGPAPNPKTDILIGGTRFSEGGRKILAMLETELKKHPEVRYKVVDRLGHRFKYCEMRHYKAIISLPYSIHSYFAVDMANLAIPIIGPSPTLMAQYEKDYHLLQERKANLNHASYNFMKQNTRSFNFGFNPNDDFNMTSLVNWMHYSDFYYWKGATWFDNMTHAIHVIKTTNFTKQQQLMEQHHDENLLKNTQNWKSVLRYLSDDGAPKTKAIAKTFEEGMQEWNLKTSPPQFIVDKGKLRSAVISGKWLILSQPSMDTSAWEKLPSDCTIVYITSSSNIKPDSIPSSVRTRVTILNSEKQKQLSYKISSNPGFGLYSTSLIGCLFAIASGASIITIPSLNQPFNDDILKNSVEFKLSEFYSIPRNAVPKNRVFHQHLMLLWAQRLGTLEKRGVTTDVPLNLDNGAKLSSSDSEVLAELGDYLSHWRTETTAIDATLNFFHVVDQLNFELAVQGFMRKLDALFLRDWLLDLASVGYPVPKHP